MAKQNLNIGVSANDGTGDTLRDGAIKLNNVINELYTYLGDNTNLQISVGSPSTNQVLKWNGSVFTEGQLSVSNLTDIDVSGVSNGQVLKWNEANARWQAGDDLQGGGGGGSSITNLSNNGSGNVVIDTHFLPNSDATYDLGSPSLKFRDLYLDTSTIWMGDTGISTDTVTQELNRRKRQEHTVNSIDTGATRTIASKLASEDSTQEEKFRLRFSLMKVGTKLNIEDATGAKATVMFASFVAENGGARGYITTTAAGADQSQELSVSSAVKITSYNRMVSEDEGGNIELGGQSLKFAAGKELKFSNDILELPSNSSIRFGDSGSTKVIAMDSSGNLDLPTGTDIRFGGDAAKSIKFDGSGNLEVPDTAEIRFGSGGTKKLKFDASNNLELPTDTEIKIGTKRMKIGSNGELEVANDGTTFNEIGGGFQSQINNAPAGASIIKGYNNATIHKPSPCILFRFTAAGSSSYTVSGPGFPASGGTSSPTVVLYRGFTYDLHNQAGGAHPLAIRTASGGSAYTTGITGSNTGMQSFTVPMDAPSTLYYQCTIHSGMLGTLDIR
jgi:hypothetical protein